MFTGIIEEVGKIAGIKSTGDAQQIEISCKKVLEQTKIGDSIAVNGICLTVTEFTGRGYRADVMPETMHRTGLSKLRVKSPVNLERAMAADGRFGGHIVSGHIDGTGEVREIRIDENAVWYTIAVEPELEKYIVEKGSIAIDGISLTVAAVETGRFQVSVIPHTRSNTSLSDKQTGDLVNLECDIVGKYVEKLLGFQAGCGKPKRDTGTSKITEAFLIENGF